MKRKSTFARGYNKRWEKLSKAFLHRFPLCVNVGKPGCTGVATCVDHIIDHKGNHARFWNSRTNWQSMCAHCHSTKTRKEQLRLPLEPRYDVNGNPTDPDHHWSKEHGRSNTNN